MNTFYCMNKVCQNSRASFSDENNIECAICNRPMMIELLDIEGVRFAAAPSDDDTDVDGIKLESVLPGDDYKAIDVVVITSKCSNRFCNQKGIDVTHECPDTGQAYTFSCKMCRSPMQNDYLPPAYQPPTDYLPPAYQSPSWCNEHDENRDEREEACPNYHDVDCINFPCDECEYNKHDAPEKGDEIDWFEYRDKINAACLVLIECTSRFNARFVEDRIREINRNLLDLVHDNTISEKD